MEQLKACSEIASARPASWQRLCAGDDSVLAWLVWAATSLEAGVAPTLLTLLQCALCPSSSASASKSAEKQSSGGSSSKKKEKSQESPPAAPAAEGRTLTRSM